MARLKKFLTDNYIALILSALFFIINLLFLTYFPFVHSDEPWLAGLSRNMMESGNFSVTERFFDLYIRNPHAIKILFHSLQIIFINLLGYNIFTVRLISLIFGTLALFVFYQLNKLIFASKPLALAALAFMAADIQFIYASHFARQEIILLFVLILSLYLFYYNLNCHGFRHDILLGIILGLSIGLHPNSFIIFMPFPIIYIYYILKEKKLKTANLLVLCFIVTLFAAVFIGISFSFDHNFLTDYIKYGEQFGVTDSFSSKFQEIKYFYIKLFYGVSGTYYTPGIKLQFCVFSSVLLLSIFKIMIKGGKHLDIAVVSIIQILAINFAVIFVGRYNQTSIIFIFPFFYILFIYLISSFNRKTSIVISSILLLLLTYNSMQNIKPWLNQSYSSYLSNIAKAVKPSDTVLANLNAEFYFQNGKLFDYRNLAFLKENNLNFEGYIKKNKIKYIIYPEEMDIIYNSRPVFNGLYGNPSTYYTDMQNFIKNKCELVYEFSDSVYAVRIMQYTNTKPWSIKIYKIKE